MTVGFSDTAMCRLTSGRTRRPHRLVSWRQALPLLLAIGACSSAGSDLPRDPAAIDGPPSPAAVRDGAARDVDSQATRQSVFANWDAFADPEGRPVVYEWCVGTTPGGSDVVPWTFVGGATQACSTALALQEGVTLYCSVRARDLVGNRSSVSTSDGVRIGMDTATTVPIATATGGAPAGTPDAPRNLAAVERFGTTWTFGKPVQAGRFVNGDWWVVGPVDIVAIDPASRGNGDRIRNGSMVNPDPRSDRQGYDTAMFAEHATGRYDATTNVALGISVDRPLRLGPGSSLVSATSHPQPGQLPQLESCVVLTVLAERPHEDAFRPPYCGTDKTCRWLAGSLDLSRLGQLAAPEGAPFTSELVQRFERTWLDHVQGWTGRYLHPRENMPDYGRDLADLVSLAALVLQLDRPLAEKRVLAIHLTQLGIDLYGIVEAGGRFAADGGSGSGRKFPVLLAGALLQDEKLSHCARDRKLAFAEDAQTFYVEQTSPGVFNNGHGGYGASDMGLPEWGNRHADDPRADKKPWTDDPHRLRGTANTWHGFVLAARIMRLREAWGHDALFDYIDRYMQTESPRTWTRSWNPFAERMWDRYRRDY